MRRIALVFLFSFLLFLRPEFAMNEESSFAYKVSLIEKAAAKYDVDAEFVMAIVMSESSFRHKVVKWEPRAKEYSRGMGQLLLSTAKLYDKKVKAKDLLVPEKNIDITTRHIAMLVDKHNGNLKKVAMEYNGGPRAKKNEKYYRRVMGYYDVLIKSCDKGRKS